MRRADTVPTKTKLYEGVVTQINWSDGSFVLRLRDGSLVTVKNPVEANIFISLKGVLDPVLNEINQRHAAPATYDHD